MRRPRDPGSVRSQDAMKYHGGWGETILSGQMTPSAGNE